ncbi:alpha/beta hydrolase [Alkalicoccus chagannorensis]|uniref:alpha/beta hydrolase n=1 Tax=Alkalicoccus chagannorensis TaxID=427072 RepID=UPI00041C8C0F|nr:alpha/beta hydrolase [Alkalicoccus chagannorensis]
MMNDTHDNLISRVKHRSHLHPEDGLQIIQKVFPENEVQGGLDPRVKALLESREGPASRRPMEMNDLQEVRNSTECNNEDISSNVRIEYKTIHLPDRKLNIRIYNRTKEEKPGIVFYHGGGFFDQDTLVMENLCKYMAQEADAVAVAVEYRLAPEHPYRAGLHDCLEGLRYVYEFASELGINAKQIGLIGDSVGGNLALGVHHLSKEEPWDISHIGLLCPLLDLSDFSRKAWSIEDYDLRMQPELIREELIAMRESVYFIQSLYLENLGDVFLSLVSPLLRENKKEFPPITMIAAEFDFLRIQAEEFSEELQQANVPLRHVEYQGMEHAFVRKLGHYPQAEDAVKEIVKDFWRVISS